MTGNIGLLVVIVLIVIVLGGLCSLGGGLAVFVSGGEGLKLDGVWIAVGSVIVLLVIGAIISVARETGGGKIDDDDPPFFNLNPRG